MECISQPTYAFGTPQSPVKNVPESVNVIVSSCRHPSAHEASKQAGRQSRSQQGCQELAQWLQVLWRRPSKQTLARLGGGSVAVGGTATTTRRTGATAGKKPPSRRSFRFGDTQDALSVTGGAGW